MSLLGWREQLAHHSKAFQYYSFGYSELRSKLPVATMGTDSSLLGSVDSQQRMLQPIDVGQSFPLLDFDRL